MDRTSPVPLYYQLQEILKQEIEDGRWTPGDVLPSEAEVSATLHVSRAVIRSALDILEADGQVYRVQGKGTVVAAPKFRYEAIGAAESWGRGTPAVEPRLHKVLASHRVAAGGHVGRLLEIPASADVIELTVAHSVEELPASLTQMFIHLNGLPSLVPGGLPKLIVGGPNVLSQLGESYGFSIVESSLTIEATRPSAYETEVLEIDQASPVFLISSLEIGTPRRPIAFSRTIVRSDQFEFSAVVQRSTEIAPIGNLGLGTGAG